MTAPTNVGPVPHEPHSPRPEPLRDLPVFPTITSVIKDTALPLLFPHDPDLWNNLPPEIRNRLREILPNGDKIPSKLDLPPGTPAWVYGMIDELLKQLKKALDDSKKTQTEKGAETAQDKEKEGDTNLLKIRIFKTEQGESSQEKKEIEKDKNIETGLKNLLAKDGDSANKQEIKPLIKLTPELKELLPKVEKEKIQQPSAKNSGSSESSCQNGNFSKTCEKAIFINQKYLNATNKETQSSPAAQGFQLKASPSAQGSAAQPAPIISSENEKAAPPKDQGQKNPFSDNPLKSGDKSEMARQAQTYEENGQAGQTPQKVVAPLHSMRMEHEARTEAQRWKGSNTIPKIADDKAPVAQWIGLFLPDMVKEGIYDYEQLRARTAKHEDVEHKLMDILFMMLCAVVCGAQTIGEMIRFIESREKWFIGILGLQYGIPSRETLWWTMVSLDPQQFHLVMAGWLTEIRGSSQLPEPGRARTTPLPFISVWESPFGLILGQRKGGAKDIESEAVPALLEAFSVGGSIVLSDFSDLAGKIAKRVCERGGEYIIAIKNIDDPSFKQVEDMFSDARENPGRYPPLKVIESYIEGQERIEVGELVCGEATHPFHSKEWHGLRSVSQVIYEPVVKEKEIITKRYCLSSLPKQSDYLFDLIRLRRGVENRADWLLNLIPYSCAFNELSERGAANLKLLWRYSAVVLSEEKKYAGTVQSKRAKALHDPEYLLKAISR